MGLQHLLGTHCVPTSSLCKSRRRPLVLSGVCRSAEVLEWSGAASPETVSPSAVLSYRAVGAGLIVEEMSGQVQLMQKEGEVVERSDRFLVRQRLVPGWAGA